MIVIGIFIGISRIFIERQRQGIILAMLGYHARSRTRTKKRRNKLALILMKSVEEVIGINNFAKKAEINNPEITRFYF